MNFSLKTANKIAKKLKNIKEGDTVKVIFEKNEKKGIQKNGRTGTVISVRGNEYDVKLHCTHTGGNNTKSVYNEKLNRYIGETEEVISFKKENLFKIL